MSSYSFFAPLYDSLMMNADYEKRAKYILKLFKKYGKKPTLMLDLACGTGNFSNIFAKDGIEVVGVDASEDMLSIAREKSQELGNTVLYLCQKAEELDLFGTVDGAVCCMDSLNHITDKKAFETAFKKVSLFLEKDSLFIFDINTPYKHEKILADNTFVLENEHIYCVWQNEYCKKSAITDISLDFFVEENGKYERFSEEFSEKAYKIDYINKLLKKNHFEVLGIFDDLTEKPLKENSERAYFVAKKIRQTNKTAK